MKVSFKWIKQLWGNKRGKMGNYLARKRFLPEFRVFQSSISKELFKCFFQAILWDSILQISSFRGISNLSKKRLLIHETTIALTWFISNNFERFWEFFNRNFRSSVKRDCEISIYSFSWYRLKWKIRESRKRIINQRIIFLSNVIIFYIFQYSIINGRCKFDAPFKIAMFERALPIRTTRFDEIILINIIVRWIRKHFSWKYRLNGRSCVQANHSI